MNCERHRLFFFTEQKVERKFELKKRKRNTFSEISGLPKTVPMLFFFKKYFDEKNLSLNFSRTIDCKSRRFYICPQFFLLKKKLGKRLPLNCTQS